MSFEFQSVFIFCIFHHSLQDTFNTGINAPKIPSEMALFNGTAQSKASVDDTDRLVCNIENAQNINKHTEYLLRVQRGPAKENVWNVYRRYRDFADLHSVLQQSNIDLPLPPKKLIGNMQPSFVAERQIALENYINEVLKHQVLALSLQVRCFLDPSNYLLPFSEQALQTVSIALRGEGRYELKGPLSDIGWRIRKHYFSVTDTETKTNCILSWQSYGPDRCLCDKDLQIAFKSLRNLSHPYIDQILAIHNLESGAYVVRRIHESGTIRDMLYGTEYSKSYLSKYGNPKIRRPFTRMQLSLYGYQILQALKFLHEKGLPHGHLHPGNIAIEDQKVKLLDIENILLGGSSVHRPYLTQLRRISSAEAVDVYSFGRTLYEMLYATPLDGCSIDYFPDQHSELGSILSMCISSASSKHGPATLDSLLNHPFFSYALHNGLASEARALLKFPLALKDELRNAVECVESRLKNDQKMERSAKREVRIQEILGSEEEMRKQRRRAKKRDLWKSTSSLAETVRSHSASTASSPTPPVQLGESVAESSPPIRSPCNNGGDGRSALLGAICAFDKSKLSRVAR